MKKMITIGICILAILLNGCNKDIVYNNRKVSQIIIKK